MDDLAENALAPRGRSTLLHHRPDRSAGRGRKSDVSKRRSALALLSLAVLPACASLPTYRYELIIEVETPEGLRTGSSVIEVRTQSEPRLLPDMTGRSTRIVGEAVAVDLPGGQTLFATLVGENGSGYAEEIAVATLLSAPERASLSRAEQVALLSETSRQNVVPRDSYPLLVRIRDIRQPNSIEGVDPDNLPATFGPGVRLKRIIVRATNSEPTFEIQERIPWLTQEVAAVARASNGVGTVLHSDAFQRR